MRVARGVTRTFQNIRLFGQLKVWQNLWVAQNSTEHRSEGFLRRWLGGPGRAREEIDRILEFSDLSGKRDELGATSPSANSAASNSPAPVCEAGAAAAQGAGRRNERRGDRPARRRIRKLKQDGLTTLLIEHHMELVMAVTDRVRFSISGGRSQRERRTNCDQSAGGASQSRRGGAAR